ncbi:potassium/proton antiporter [Bacillus kwashiorkori]|uniref:potassium/proton antiporter n=1 Tax=Bacillus kwashiorkori TaxID=1522318 RepID=UPI000781C58E|nr:potassium/proton antiporter [Bacillus kwashiorkori]
MDVSVDIFILTFGILLLIGVISTRFSTRLRIPTLLIFIIVGMLLNRFIYFDNANLTQLISIAALVIILFDGGLKTNAKDIRSVIVPSSVLATVGVLLTSVITGLFAVWILNFSILEGMLLGAIVGSTDAAAVFAAFGNTNIKKRLTHTLEFESGSNDPMAVFLTLSIIELIQIPDKTIFSLLGNFFWQMGIGIIFSLIFGKLTVKFINYINFQSAGLYSIFSLSIAVLTYSSVTLINGSGLLAVYLMAIYIGNSDIHYKQSILHFNDGLASMSQICMFILLGLLVFPSHLLEVIWQSILLSLAIILIARPVSVFLCTIGMKFSLNEKIFISWAGLKGAVPIILATYPLLAGIENSATIFNIVFFIVLLSALIQGTTLTFLAEKLNLTVGKTKKIPFRLELMAAGDSDLDLSEIMIGDESNVINQRIAELSLPADLVISAIVRENDLVTPRGETRLKSGDILYILAPKKYRTKIEKYFVK